MLSDDTVGALLLQNGILSEANYGSCIQRLAEMKGREQKTSLCQMVLDSKWTDAETMSAIIEKGGGRLSKCSGCKLHFAVEGEAARCPSCNEDLRHVESAVQIQAYPGGKVDPLISKTLGGFVLKSRIGGGATSTFYFGENEAGEKATVKILRPQLADSQDIVDRFRQEALASDLLDHECIPKLITKGESGGRQYMALEHVEGKSLEEFRTEGHRFAVQEAVRIMKKLLNAVDHCHRSGITHRNIRPENIIRTTDGGVKLIDFGLSKDLGEEKASTRKLAPLDMPAFMSPEQAEGESAGPLADIYACGAVLFVMLSARRPFEAMDIRQMLERVIHDPVPSLITRVPDLPASVNAVVQRMMAKDQSRRYPTAALAFKALDEALINPFRREPGLEDTAHAEDGMDPMVWVIIGGALLLGLILFLLLR